MLVTLVSSLGSDARTSAGTSLVVLDLEFTSC